MTAPEDAVVLAMGNDAIARGALEAGVQVATSYPGTPASEILENLAAVAKDCGIYVEWSTNEKVAFEVAVAAAWAGLRAVTSMKQNGLFVLLDTLVNVAYTGHGRGGLVLVVADDPQAHSSTTEADVRFLGHYADIPVLEPSTHQEGKDMMAYAFELSEGFGIPVLVRETTRFAHSQRPLRVGPIVRQPRRAAFDHATPLFSIPRPTLRHEQLHQRLNQIRGRFERSPWNRYTGPEDPALLVVTAGTGWLYSNEALRLFDLEDRVGILRIGTLSPLPYRFIQEPLRKAKDILFLEEFDPYLETLIRSDACTLDLNPRPRFLGKLTGHLPQWGELTIDDTLRAVAQLTGIKYAPVSADYGARTEALAAQAPPRSLTFCAGCPHRAAYYAIYRAIKRNGNRGFVTGDIGCYSLGAFYHDLMRSQLAMGTGVGLASGFGRLQAFGLDEPVIAVIGDSTLYHAGLPALVNIRYNQADATVCVLDNQATAMTGFQPHPGTGSTALGKAAPVIDIEKLLKGLGFTDVVVVDPYSVTPSTNAVYKAITTPGSHAIIFRRVCPLAIRQPVTATGRTVAPHIDAAKCLGAQCRLCVAEFNCPALILDPETNRVHLDSLLCVGCGVCTRICPHHAIVATRKRAKEAKR